MSVQFQKFRCLKCGNEWTPRIPEPKMCPGCKNRRWWEPRKRVKTQKDEGVGNG
jgi:predicted Zn-ribbon and HTH transcriptional regulator